MSSSNPEFVRLCGYFKTGRFRLPFLHILHVRCQFLVIRAVRRNLNFACLSKFARKSIVRRDGQAQERTQAILERNRRRFERKKSTFLVRAANAPVRAANSAPAKKLKVNLTLPLEVDQTTTMYS